MISAVLVAAALFFAIRFSSAINRKPMSHDEIHSIDMRRDQSVVCPKCKKGMVPGFSTAQKGINFRGKHEEKHSQFRYLAKTLPNTMNYGFAFKANTSWHCPTCQMLIIDHSTMIKPGRDGEPS